MAVTYTYFQDSGGQWWRMYVNASGDIVTEQTTAPTPSSSTSSATKTAANVIDVACQKLNYEISNEHPLMVTFTDEIHKEILRKTKFRFLLSDVKAFTTTAGISDYKIGTTGTALDTGLALTDMRTIYWVKDTTNHIDLFKTDEAPNAQWMSSNSYPKLFRWDISSPSTLSVYPPPNGAYNIQFRYFKQINDISTNAVLLQTPDVYFDVVVNGVVAKAFGYLRRMDDAALYHELYMAGLQQMITEKNAFPRNDFMYPGV